MWVVIDIVVSPPQAFGPFDSKESAVAWAEDHNSVEYGFGVFEMEVRKP